MVRRQAVVVREGGDKYFGMESIILKFSSPVSSVVVVVVLPYDADDDDDDAAHGRECGSGQCGTKM